MEVLEFAWDKTWRIAIDFLWWYLLLYDICFEYYRYEEIKVALCAILPKFQFRLVDPSSVKLAFSLTLPAKNGMVMHVFPRDTI